LTIVWDHLLSILDANKFITTASYISPLLVRPPLLLGWCCKWQYHLTPSIILFYLRQYNHLSINTYCISFFNCTVVPPFKMTPILQWKSGLIRKGDLSWADNLITTHMQWSLINTFIVQNTSQQSIRHATLMLFSWFIDQNKSIQ
jgi:hypothetical protein